MTGYNSDYLGFLRRGYQLTTPETQPNHHILHKNFSMIEDLNPYTIINNMELDSSIDSSPHSMACVRSEDNNKSFSCSVGEENCPFAMMGNFITTCSREERKEFLRFFTGHTTINKNTTGVFRIGIDHKNTGYPEGRTCANNLKFFLNQDETQSSFQEKMLTAMKHNGSFGFI